MTDGQHRAGRQPTRADRIQELRWLADWFEAHPDVPVPTVTSLHVFIKPEDEPDEQLRVSAALAAMKAAGVEAPQENDRTVHGAVALVDGNAMLYVSAFKDEVYGRRYLV